MHVQSFRGARVPLESQMPMQIKVFLWNSSILRTICYTDDGMEMVPVSSVGVLKLG